MSPIRHRSHGSCRSVALLVALTAAGLLHLASAPGRTVCAQSSGTVAPLPTIEERTAGMTAMEGFFDLYWDDSTGHLFWEIDRFEEEFLYAVSLTSGLGSNPVGLDRGQLGGTWILKARRIGPRILLIQPNYRFRARSDNPLEVEAVANAFAPSTQWGFEIEARSDERVLVDATDFFLRDTHGAGARMQGAGQGAFRLDRSRSVFHLPRTKTFPTNCEVETWLTFTSDSPGPLVSGTAADGRAVSLIQHHSLVALPDDGYLPRRADPRVSSGSMTFSDYATPIDEDLKIQFLRRSRCPGTDLHGSERGSRLVERGLRGGRIHRRLPGEGPSGRGRSDGPPVQHDPLDPSLHPRLVVRGIGHRSTHG